MKFKQTNKKRRYLLIAGLIALVLSVCVLGYFVFFTLDDAVFYEMMAEDEPDNIVVKLETINQIDKDYLLKRYGEIETLFGNCDAQEEHEAILKRLTCAGRLDKAVADWRDMSLAEEALKMMIQQDDIEAIGRYLSCDAYDLTWYEMHCEADRLFVRPEHIMHLLTYIQTVNKNLIEKAVWKRETPDMRIFRDPKWLMRSRLVNTKLKLKDPWKSEAHPTESGTIIMLEQKLDGKIYIVGIPVTGTF